MAVEDNLLSREDSDTLFELYDKAQENEGGIFGIGALGLSVEDSKKLTDLVILDQVGNALISKYNNDPSKLNDRELEVLSDILNYYYASGGDLNHIQRLLTYKGPSFQSPNYLFNSGTGGVYEEIFDKAATTRNLDAEARRYDQIGEAVWGAPGKFMNIARIILGAHTVATGVQNIQQGNTGLGVFQVGVGGLMFIPINGKPVPATSATTVVDGSAGQINAPRRIEYIPDSSYVRQASNNDCGPTCVNMVINDKSGNSVDLATVTSQFTNIRNTGVNIDEIQAVLSSNGISSTKHTNFYPGHVQNSLAQGETVILNIPIGRDGHFVIIDGIRQVDGVNYYLIRDPYVGSYGAPASQLDSIIVNKYGVNVVVIGE